MRSGLSHKHLAKRGEHERLTGSLAVDQLAQLEDRVAQVGVAGSHAAATDDQAANVGPRPGVEGVVPVEHRVVELTVDHADTGH